MATEGQTAIGPNGERAVFTGGRWVVQGGAIQVAPGNPYGGQQAAAEAARASNQAEASVYDPQLKDLEARLKNIELQKRITELEAAQGDQSDAETQQAAKSYRQRLRSGNILEAIAEARNLARQGGTGMGSLAAPIPATMARELQATIAPIKATLAFDRLQEMRDESKTGGALGAVSERELNLLEGAVAALDQGRSPEGFLNALDKLERHFIGSQLALSGIDPASDDGQAVFREYGVPCHRIALCIAAGVVGIGYTTDSFVLSRVAVGRSHGFAVNAPKSHPTAEQSDLPQSSSPAAVPRPEPAVARPSAWEQC